MAASNVDALDAAALQAKFAGVVHAFHDLYYRSEVWKDTSWLGVNTRKCPLDLHVYQEILEEIRPELVIETGTFHGGSALFFATILDAIERHVPHGVPVLRARVVSVDVDQSRIDPRARHHRVHFFEGSSVDEAVLSRVREIAALKKTMVVLDSDHSQSHVLAELRAYAPLVSPGSYLVVEDTNVVTPDGEEVGAAHAVREFLASPEGELFEADDEREKFMLTFNPGGWLRRRSPLDGRLPGGGDA